MHLNKKNHCLGHRKTHRLDTGVNSQLETKTDFWHFSAVYTAQTNISLKDLTETETCLCCSLQFPLKIYLAFSDISSIVKMVIKVVFTRK